MQNGNSKANPKAQMAVRCSAWFGIVLIQSQESPAQSVRNRCDGRPCHRASDPKTLCALCVLCGENRNAKPQRTQGPQRRNNFKGSLGQLQRTDGAERSSSPTATD